MGYGRIRIGEYGWTWDEKEEVLRDNKGIIRERRVEGIERKEGGVK